MPLHSLEYLLFLILSLGFTVLFAQRWRWLPIEPSRRRVAILFLGPDLFNNVDNIKLPYEMEILKNDLSMTDLYPLWLYSDSLPHFFTNAAILTFRPLLFKQDLENFAQNPMKRLGAIGGLIKTFSEPISPDFTGWETDWEMGVENIVNLEELPSRIEALPPGTGERKRLEEVWLSYSTRRYEKRLDPDAFRQYRDLLARISSRYRQVYVFVAPIYEGFIQCYPYRYREGVLKLARKICRHFPNATYIPQDRSINADPHLFRDVVHLNRPGAERATRHIMRYIR